MYHCCVFCVAVLILDFSLWQLLFGTVLVFPRSKVWCTIKRCLMHNVAQQTIGFIMVHRPSSWPIERRCWYHQRQPQLNSMDHIPSQLERCPDHWELESQGCQESDGTHSPRARQTMCWKHESQEGHKRFTSWFDVCLGHAWKHVTKNASGSQLEVMISKHHSGWNFQNELLMGWAKDMLLDWSLPLICRSLYHRCIEFPNYV